MTSQRLSTQTTASNATEQCWKTVAGGRDQLYPLFSLINDKCFVCSTLECFTALGPAPESACAANEPDVSVLVTLDGSRQPVAHCTVAHLLAMCVCRCKTVLYPPERRSAVCCQPFPAAAANCGLSEHTQLRMLLACS